MQYHLEGFRAGDPSRAPAARKDARDAVDVLIIGCGPAGLTLATQLSLPGDVSVRIVDRRPGPLEIGQADGIACRSVEMFEAFGFADRVIREGYQVSEVSFWRPGPDGTTLTRADRIKDVEDGLSEMPHIILSQARIHDFYLETMAHSARRLVPEYNLELLSLERDDRHQFPVTATLKRGDRPGETETIRARYVAGCDGARSVVRSELGLALRGSSARQLWGVMDVLVRTTFPDIRLKCAIQSAEQGSMLIIPREGGYMVRLYIELDALGPGERASDRGVTPDELIDKARRILSPFEFDVASIAWWSAYEIGQRVCDAFDDAGSAGQGAQAPRIFIAGDACHTHSPKAGQGMNVSMADAFNLGWKLAAVLRGQSPAALLDTYNSERRAKAQELIDFDRDMARLFSEKPETGGDVARFQAYFRKHGRYTAGVETCYGPSLITGGAHHQNLATGYPVGKRFHSAPVIRLADAKPMQLGHALKADGRWRIIIFAPQSDDGTAAGQVGALCQKLRGLTSRVSPSGADPDEVIDVRAVFQSPHRRTDVATLPAFLVPRKGSMGLTDYEKVFCPDPDRGDIFDMRGIDRDRGAVIVVRPDQYVSLVVPVTGDREIEGFFAGVLLS
ncbi:FAD-dependent monooxygenase [Roseobacter ponti]|uniref:3-hydroxybenzoate 4-monooxygenase n=1 Tax=Roseobacter ponti TaxID=1891787 RepID=A0A858SS63_9RHOB|nr:FAD-dependent monooxygenase [Roseobacter ponti]QJF50748.1 3-hydroxybenzoate 4-monooxygenase [Roseobacter ponti]